jgi:predicted PurR-regulated permease PerM
MAFSKEHFQTAFWLLIGLAMVWLLVDLGPVLMPFIVGGIFAYILNPLVDRLANISIRRWHFPRSLAACIAIVALLLVVLALAFIVIPVVQKEFFLLREQIPLFLDRLNTFLTPRLHDYGIQLKLDSASVRQMLSEYFAESEKTMMQGMLASVKVGGMAVLGLIASIVLIPMVLYYLLVDWHIIWRRLHSALPRRFATQVMTLVRETDDLLAQYLRGQLLVMFILTVYYSSALAIAGLSVALPVGILTGLLVFIPYLGFGLGLCLAVIAAALQFDLVSGLMAIAVVYGIGQVLESFYLTPKLVGKRIGLPPLMVIFALLAFGQLFGFIGVLLALPASAIVSVGFKHLREFYFQSRFYSMT